MSTLELACSVTEPSGLIWSLLQNQQTYTKCAERRFGAAICPNHASFLLGANKKRCTACARGLAYVDVHGQK